MPQALRRSLSVATATAVAASALVALGGAGVANAAAYPTINEFSFDTSPGNDVEYFEIHAAEGTSLTGYTLLGIEGDSNGVGVLDNRIVLDGAVTDANGLYARGAVVPGSTAISPAFENGALSLLLVTGTVPAAGTDLDTNDDGVLDEGLGFTIVDSVAVTDGSGATGVTYGGVTLSAGFDGSTFDVGGASRIPDGVDTNTTADWMRNDFNGAGIDGFAGSIALGEAYNTPGAPNEAYTTDVPEPVCGATGATLISAVQGAGAASPIAGTTVEIEGVVTAVHAQLAGAAGTGTFAVQEEAADQDADPATSEGISVELPSSLLGDIAVGHQVRVQGTVSEEFGRTHLDGAGYSTCADSVALPAPVELAIPFEADLEATEGMLVTFPQELTILETYDFARYGELALGSELQHQPTDVFEPGSAEAEALLASNWANRILLDDAVTAQNADPARHPNGQPYTLENRFRAGDHVADVTGILDYGFSAWRIQPTTGATVTTVNERPEVPQVGGELQVAAFNVLNYFTTLGDRGAQTPAELQRQQDKLVAAILAMDADIVGLMEIENGGTALTTLVAAINEAAGTELYSAIETGPVGTDAISTAIIYQASAVTPEGGWVALDETIDPRFDTSLNRPAITQSFAIGDTGEVLTVSVNHLKSKGSECASGADPNGQGNCNAERTEAATALAEWLETDPTQSGSPHSIIIGDLNSYAMEDPIVAIEAAGFVDLLPEHDGPGEYTYTFDGMLGSLDHAMASESLASMVVDAAAWHTNTDEVSLIDYTMEFKQPAQDAIYAPDPFRASDHDAVLVGLTLEALPEPEVEVTTLAGADRYETNVLTSQTLFEPGTDVFLASGEGFVDALAAGPAAAHEGASLLLTPAGRLLDATAAELERLAPETITIVGGEPSVSAAVEAAVAALLPDATIERIAGADRFETAAELATSTFGTAEGAFLASGLSFADALSASGVAAQRGDVPVLLTMPDALPAATASALEELGAADVAVLGSRVTVSDGVLRQARAYGDVLRVAGADRYATNALMVGIFGMPGSEGAVAIASGANFPDALSATAVAGQLDAPLLLSPGQCVLLEAEDAIAALDPQRVVNVGGRPTLESDAWQTAC